MKKLEKILVTNLGIIELGSVITGNFILNNEYLFWGGVTGGFITTLYTIFRQKENPDKKY